MEKTSVSLDFAGKTLTFETGSLAPQATSSIFARVGETVVLVTVVEGKLREDIDWFPLSVEYVERLYAGGRIKGSRWVKREGRPSDEAVLIGRLIDRSIRPLFPKEYRNEVQVIVTVLSVDGENEPDILALNAVSAALAISPIPWQGPIGAIRMGLVNDPQNGGSEVIFNPTTPESEHSELDLIVSQLSGKTVMVEAGARQVPEKDMHNAIIKAHDETGKMIKFIEDLMKKVGQSKKEVIKDTQVDEIVAIVEKSYKAEVKSLIAARVQKESGGGAEETDALIKTIAEQHKAANPDSEISHKNIAKAVEKVMYKIIRADTIKTKKRVDGRAIDEIRKLDAEVGVLPRTHGSAVFQRGLTQALTVATLGSPRMEQLIESAEGEEAKRYIHHYSGLPYSFGSTGRVMGPGRREIGHGALAERALEAVIPGKDVFPYTIRLVSEVLSQNGSSSMASTCGSTLALMDAGVPITAPVAGIVVGMMSDEKDYVLLTDIVGIEDFSGDMDFKVTGTEAGITAIQMDTKILGLTDQQIAEILDRARAGRMVVLEKMLSVMPKSRTEVSKFAPKIEVIKIPVEKIGELIGPGGKTIKNIIAQTGAQVDVEDDGSVTVSGVGEEEVQKAAEWVRSLTREVMAGEEFEGTVVRILPFGAFVEILPGKDGMVHVSQLADGFVKNPEDIVHIGDKVKVRVMEIDEQGRINLTMKLNAPTQPAADEQDGGQPQPQFPPREQRDFRGPRGGGGRPGGPAPRQGGRPGGVGFRSDAPRDDRAPRSEHPLSRQFQRERQSRPGVPGSRPSGPRKRFSR